MPATHRFLLGHFITMFLALFVPILVWLAIHSTFLAVELILFIRWVIDFRNGKTGAD